MYTSIGSERAHEIIPAYLTLNEGLLFLVFFRFGWFMSKLLGLSSGRVVGVVCSLFWGTFVVRCC